MSLRRAALRLFCRRGFCRSVALLEADIESGRISVRTDRDMWRDVGERRKIVRWLFSYNPLWLRIGLEAVYGEVVPMDGHSDWVGLSRFIVSRLLWDQRTATDHHHLHHRPGMLESLSRFTL
ncbi:abnormal spindle-like microcephaly-associated protein homolog, partial [Lampetra fluviatilis]